MKRKALLLGMCVFAGVSQAWGQWSLQVVDPHARAGVFNDLRLDAGGKPHVAYYTLIDDTHYLRYGRYDGANWDLQTVESVGTSVGHGVALALDSNDWPHIGYKHRDGFKYAHNDSSGWSVATVDAGSGRHVGMWPAIVVDSQDYPRAVYHDNNVGNKYAVRDAAGWEIESPLGSGMEYPGVSLTLDDADNAHIAGVVSSQLAYAVRTGTGWDTQTHIAWGGVNSSLALDRQGYPHIAHGEHNADVVRYTYFDGPSGIPTSSLPTCMSQAASPWPWIRRTGRGSASSPTTRPGSVAASSCTPARSARTGSSRTSSTSPPPDLMVRRWSSTSRTYPS